MKIIYSNLVLLLLAFLIPSLPIAAETEKTTPEDRPISGNQKDLDDLTAPYMEMSRRAFPDIRKRFLKGLPADHDLYVTVRISDTKAKTFEQVFVLVEGIDGEQIAGRIASEMTRVSGYSRGDAFKCKTDEIQDWTITAPDGSEEGNFVGKFLDVIQDGRVPLIIKMETNKDGTIASAEFEGAINRYQQDVSYCIPESAKMDAVKIVKAKKYDPKDEISTSYTYLIYLYHEGRVESPKEATKRSTPSTEPPRS